jgi:hypothetical protein
MRWMPHLMTRRLSLPVLRVPHKTLQSNGFMHIWALPAPALAALRRALWPAHVRKGGRLRDAAPRLCEAVNSPHLAQADHQAPGLVARTADPEYLARGR